MKHYLLVGFLFVFFVCFAQDIDRVAVAGTITAPIGEDVEGVTIYNRSSQKGAITDADGLFQIEVAENDRVLITAMQYQTFTVIIDSGVVTNKVMNIYLNPAVNKLDEVIVRPYDLSGNIRADVGTIETNTVMAAWDLSYETLEFEYEFAPDENSSVVGNRAEEAYYNGQKPYDGVSIIGIIGLFASKKTKFDLAREYEEKAMVRGGLVQRFPKQFVLDTFGIAEDDYGLFIYFAEDTGIPKSLLKEENAVELLDFLFAQSKAFKEERGKE
jgi:hypothetical protein